MDDMDIYQNPISSFISMVVFIMIKKEDGGKKVE